MAFDIEAARADGFTDEEIKAYLASQGQSMPAPAAAAQQPAAQPMPTVAPDQPLDRSAENATTAAMAAGAGAAAVGLPAALAYAVKSGVGAGAKAMDVAKQGINTMQEQNAVARAHQQLQYDKLAARAGAVPGPVAPATSPILGPNGQPLPAAQPAAAPAAAPAAPAAVPEARQMTAARSIVQKLALDKVLKGAGAAGGLAALGAGLFYTSPEEIAILKEAERRKKAGMQ